MATKLIDLIESVNADDLPTNEFTIEDKDPMVILGKLNEVIAYLQTLQATINASDSKANEALQKAIQAVADATQALSVANGIDAKATQALANAIEAVGTANTALSASNTALSTANTAISTANTALSSANSAVETAEGALDTAESAETKADTAITTANGAKTTAEGIDAKATTALSNSQTAVSTANEAKSTAQEALDQVVGGLGTKVYRDTTLLNSLDIKPIEDDIADNTTAITALQTGKVDKVTGKQLSTEDFTTAEKNKLAGLNNYDDTQIQADITALQTGKVDKVTGKQLSTEDFTTAEKNKLAGLNDYIVAKGGGWKNWWRVWASGWLEQGGYSAKRVADYGTYIVNFSKSFADDEYTAVLGTDYSTNDGTWANAICISTHSTTQLKIYCRGAKDGGRYVSWYCAGQKGNWNI